ncbi:PQQ-dependent sugar dehydrogenase [Azospirillum thermophilum]|uniref:Sorbosone dehydrogenase n=1 Tax=Azospirillum thermophilum TaxID=2202148 RepID=A0A2S2CS72_9PROT|nr:PQQ-dependent sugar dehydrogenase [Azospirillum thermophilum]AWK87373.1 sorbosone dehydrogenase [Azospirillum thermophilum]
MTFRRAALFGLALAAAATPALAQRPPGQSVGDSIHVRVQDLPKPYETPAVAVQAESVKRPARDPLRVPEGFTVTLFRDNVDHARNLLTLPNGDVLVAQQRPGSVTLLRDADGDGKAELAAAWATGFDRPYGLAYHDGAVYVGDLAGVWRLPWTEGAAKAGERRRITADGAFGKRGGHNTRTVAVSPDGRTLYVGIGSDGNIDEEPEPRATIQAFSIDGGNQRTFASGLRNAVGMAFRPGSSELYTVVNERDGLGDQLVPDYLTRVQEGGFYGWPYSYLGSNPQPDFAEKRPDLVKRAIVPDVLFQAHSAPLGLVFGDRTIFPEKYRAGAFVALHGSWNRSDPVGYTVAFVPFRDGKPTGGYEIFAAGFRMPGGSGPARVWGRPSGLSVARDGSLLIADDYGAVWRVVHRGG